MSQSNGEGEATLVIRSRSGDRAAFEELVRKTARGVFAQVFLQTADAHRAEDIVQETFLRAWSRIRSLDDPKLFRPWVRSIAKSALLDAVKRENRKKRGWFFRRRDQRAMLELEDQSASPGESIEQDEQRRQVLELLKTLPREYQDVISLRYLTGADYQTIAKQLAISNGSLRGLLARGLRMLRERLIGHEEMKKHEEHEESVKQ